MKNTMRRFLILFFMFPLLRASAQTDTARLLETAVVTAQKQPTVQLQGAYSQQRVSGSMLLSGQARTTPEMLHGINGVWVQKTNHGGGSPFIRGLTGNQSLLLVDGIRLNNSTFRFGPNQYLNTIDGYTLAAVEVAKGTGSVQYGSDALGGVIQVLTREPVFATEKEKGWGGALTGKIFTQGMEQGGRGDVHYSSDKLAFLGGVTRRSFGDVLGGDTTGKQSPSGYEEWAYDAKLKYKISGSAVLTAAHQWLRQQDVPVFHKVLLENFAVNQMNPQDRRLSYLRLELKPGSRWWRSVQFTVSHQQNREGREQRKNGSNTTRFEDDRVRTLGFTAETTSEITEKWTAFSGIELYHDRVSSSRRDVTVAGVSTEKVLRGLYPDGARYGNYSVYSLHEYRTGKWRLEAGIRYNWFAACMSDTATGTVTLHPQALVGNAAVSFLPGGGHHIYVNANTGYRAPNIDDLGSLGVVDFRFEQPNSNLRPEQSRYAELGYKWQGRRLSLQAAGWYMHLHELITRQKLEGQVINGYAVYEKQNTGSSFIKGLEAELEYNICRQLRVNGGVSYTYGQDLSNHEPMRRIPPLTGRLAARWRSGRWEARTELLAAGRQVRLAKGDRDDNRIPAGGTPGWTTLNCYGSGHFGKLVINTGFVNLFNTDYRTHGSGINGMGRSAYISATIQF